MKYMTVKDLREYLNSHNIPDDAEVMFVDGSGTGVHVLSIKQSRVGVVDCLDLCNKGVEISC